MFVILLVVGIVVPRKLNQPPRVIKLTNGLFIANSDYQRHRRARRQYWINKYKCSKGCELCGYNAHGVALDFDHLDRRQKKFNVSSQSMMRKLKDIFKEIRKCRVLCANCHRLDAYKKRDYRNKKHWEKDQQDSSNGNQEISIQLR